jgi:hypothetical protein
MIQIKHTVTFPKHIALSSLSEDSVLVELLKVQTICREEASKRGCIFFKDVVESDNSLVMNFIWFTKDESDTFIKWANDTHDYENVYTQFVNRIQELGGTVVREETSLAD